MEERDVSEDREEEEEASTEQERIQNEEEVFFLYFWAWTFLTKAQWRLSNETPDYPSDTSQLAHCLWHFVRSNGFARCACKKMRQFWKSTCMYIFKKGLIDTPSFILEWIDVQKN